MRIASEMVSISSDCNERNNCLNDHIGQSSGSDLNNETTAKDTAELSNIPASNAENDFVDMTVDVEFQQECTDQDLGILQKVPITPTCRDSVFMETSPTTCDSAGNGCHITTVEDNLPCTLKLTQFNDIDDDWTDIGKMKVYVYITDSSRLPQYSYHT